MPRPVEIVAQIPVTLSKAELAATAPFGERLNCEAILLDDRLYAEGEIVFVAFVGRRVGPGQYAGHYCFREPARNPPSESADLNQLPRFTAAPDLAPFLEDLDVVHPHD